MITKDELLELLAERRVELETARGNAAAALRELESAARAFAQVEHRLELLERLEKA